jgi:DNA-directed RNA polymerase subunit RPC12/RpoP
MKYCSFFSIFSYINRKERKRFCSECGYDTNENKQEKIKEKKETVCSNCGAKMDINIKIRKKQ